MTFLWRWRVLQPFSWSHSFQKTCLLSPYTPLFFIFFVTMVISLAQTLNSSHLVSHHKRVLICLLSLPRWLSGKEPNCQCRRCRFDPWVRKIPWRRKWQHTPVFLPGKSHGQRSLVSCSPWGWGVRHVLVTEKIHTDTNSDLWISVGNGEMEAIWRWGSSAQSYFKSITLNTEYSIKWKSGRKGPKEREKKKKTEIMGKLWGC